MKKIAGAPGTKNKQIVPNLPNWVRIIYYFFKLALWTWSYVAVCILILIHTIDINIPFNVCLQAIASLQQQQAGTILSTQPLYIRTTGPILQPQTVIGNVQAVAPTLGKAGGDVRGQLRTVAPGQTVKGKCSNPRVGRCFYLREL